MSKLSNLILYETKSVKFALGIGFLSLCQRFYIIGRTESERHHYKTLKIDRSKYQPNLVEDETVYTSSELNELLKMIDTGNDATGGLKKVCTIAGIIGFVRFLHGFYLYVITGAKVIAEIAGHEIFTVDSTRLISLEPFPERSHEENRLLSTFSSVDLSKNFYFSYTYDITNTLQCNLAANKKKTFNEMFVWNYHLLQNGFTSITPYSPWTLALVHGYICQMPLKNIDRSIFLTVIARRSRHFAGARFHKRGVNDDGYVANEVETEQIVFDSSFKINSRLHGCTSFVQHRGSIPLYWSQDISNLSPKPPIQINAHDPFYAATALHFDRMISRYGAPICILNLIKHRESVKRESILLDEYGAAVQYLNRFLPLEKKIKYVAFDMSKASKSPDQDVISILEKISDRYIQITKHFTYSNKKLSQQNGIARTNCIDCLDRTNAAQFILARSALAHQLFELALIPEPKLSMDCDVVKLLMEMYHDHGDIIAMQYGGSALVNTMETYRKTSPWTSQSRDMIETLRRYYSNSFTDSDKQDSINLFLGNYERKLFNDVLKIELKAEYNYLTNRPKSYKKWISMDPESTLNCHFDGKELKRKFEDYYSNWQYTSFSSDYRFELNSRYQLDPFSNPFEAMGVDETSKTSIKSITKHLAIKDESTVGNKYPPNSSAKIAQKNLLAIVKAEETNEYERYIAHWDNLKFYQDIKSDPEKYNLNYYDGYMRKFEGKDWKLQIEAKDSLMYTDALKASPDGTTADSYRKWLETGRY